LTGNEHNHPRFSEEGFVLFSLQIRTPLEIFPMGLLFSIPLHQTPFILPLNELDKIAGGNLYFLDV
jgi:hypothetical protein